MMRTKMRCWGGLLGCLVATTGAAQAPEEKASGIDTSLFSETVRPGEDFYQYANERWLEETEIPGDRSDYGTFTILDDRTKEQVRAIIEEAGAEEDAPRGSVTQKVGDFYRAYTDVEERNRRGSEPLQPLLDQVRAIDSEDALGPAMAWLDRRGVGHLFGFYINPDARRSEQYGVYLTQSGTTLPDRDYYLKDEPRYEQLREELRQYVADLLSAIDHPNAEPAAERIVALETKLAEAQWTNVENRDPVRTYNKRTSEEMAELLGNLRWPALADTAGIAVQEDFIVRQPSFFETANELVESVPLETWKDYLAFRAADAYAPALSESIERLHFAFHQTAISGVAEQKPLWRRAVEATNGAIGELVGKLYVERHFPPEAKERMEEMVDNLQKAFAVRIENLEWMTPGTKQQALEKLSQFNTKIGYPDKWKDYSKLEVEPDDAVGNLIRAAEVLHEREVDKLGGPIDRTEWHMTPQTINAYYNPLMNEIVFPAAILQPPFFDLEADDAANYGAIGAVIGHEISHGFDDKGSKYDGRGNLRNWWTEEDRREFEERAEDLVEQFDAYQPFEDMHVNGELTLGENIGDLGGLSVSHHAYRISLGDDDAPQIDSLSGDQRFFLGWAQIWRRLYREQELRRRLLVDPHSPSRYRTNGIVRNMDAFYEAFSVDEKDAMYLAPEDRVKIW